MPFDESQLPGYALLSPENVKLYEVATAEGIYNLTPAEKWWRDRWQMLASRGYKLRPRYHPSWKPSWVGTRVDPIFCEDSIILLNPHIIDATWHNKVAVSIKCVERSRAEIDLAQSLVTEALLSNDMNHCVPILDAIQDPVEQDTWLMVMPYLCPFDDPPFGAVGEVLDFVRQTLEGLLFLHNQGVAHRDCAAANIMMDGRPLYPNGHHPLRRKYTPDAIFPANPLSRIDHPVRYYFIDFGISTRFRRGASPFVTGRKGRDKELPELSDDVPYDAFKADIFILGNLYKKEFLLKYHGVDFLAPLINSMTQQVASSRPGAEVALAEFRRMSFSLTSTELRWRLRPRDESVPERVVYDTFAAARETFFQLKRIVGQ
ncbi:hypothetical protein FA95DRAFT_1571003 [Auriscalpium vulgare]|uniref:Uncharacterized protein n=1 Tax=Auriscalpium vulgare TaxID=40419 RepID=A0ACB8S0V0_9AGAM|nr:hypothetical protein FA95DRAFT_1571003 [Auriscalpium vulgare]